MIVGIRSNAIDLRLADLEDTVMTQAEALERLAGHLAAAAADLGQTSGKPRGSNLPAGGRGFTAAAMDSGGRR